jgi:flagellar motility protein MotE (MotC chaperone)
MNRLRSIVQAGRRLALTLLIALLAVSAVARVVAASLATLPEDDAASEASVLLCPPSDEVSDLLARLAERDAALEAREAVIALRERDVEVARQEALAAIDRMREAEAALTARMHTSSQASEEDITRLVSVYEGMKPKDAAVLFEAMAPEFAAGFLARMRPDAASGIFSSLPPDTAYALSVIMAGRNANAATE